MGIAIHNEPVLTSEKHVSTQVRKKYLEFFDLPSVKSNAAMRRIAALIQSARSAEVTALIAGESGVGKEILARTIHNLSPRHDKRMVAINCASVVPSLLEVELFGCERGAFTGADSRRLGKFELAQKGTLFLDEISEISPEIQAKLLRVIQERETYRVGGNRSIPLNVRLIATTNRDLQGWVASGNFREDLYHRLNVLTLKIPALRDRKEDIPVYAKYFLNRLHEDDPSLPSSFSDQAIQRLVDYPWPGNVRELENIVTRSAFMTKGKRIHDLCFDEIKEPQSGGYSPFLGTIEEMEQMMIMQSLRTFNGNRVKAAQALGISVRKLRYKLNQYRQVQALSFCDETNEADI